MTQLFVKKSEMIDLFAVLKKFISLIFRLHDGGWPKAFKVLGMERLGLVDYTYANKRNDFSNNFVQAFFKPRLVYFSTVARHPYTKENRNKTNISMLLSLGSAGIVRIKQVLAAGSTTRTRA